ncbi:cytochrome P450 [Crassisporium funariophilum]|nr:cytochrome P450 [Crassisporium funariophilum]
MSFTDHHLLQPRHLLIPLIAYIAYYILNRLILWPRFLSPLRNLPGPPLGSILFGQSPLIIRSETGIPQREWVKQYGPVVRVVGPVGIERLIFMKPEALHQILVKDWLEYPRPTFLRNILGLVTGYGLLTVTGNDHKQMRKAMNPAFSIPNLMAQTHMYFEPINGLVDILKKDISAEKQPDKGKIIHVYDWMSKVTLDIICETAFGYKADSLHNPHNELAEAYELLISLQSGSNLARLIVLVSLPGGPRFLASDWAYHHRHWLAKIPLLGKTFLSSFYRHTTLSGGELCAAAVSKLVDAMYRIRKISSRMLQEKMKDSNITTLNDTDAKRDIMSILVRARKAELDGGTGGYAMSDRAMMDQVLTFLGAGHETTASGLTWTLWHLSNNPDSQRRLRAELAPVFAENPCPDYRTLKDLRWLDCVVMESLRVMPPVPLTARIAAKTGYIDGVLVPKGTLLWIPVSDIRIVNTWKEIWGEDAEEFNPARWLALPKAYHPTFSLLSFIAGPHACIGKTMSIIEMKAVLAALIVNFEFEPSAVGQVAHPAAAITIKPTDGMPLRVRRVSPLGPFSTGGFANANANANANAV